MDSSFFVLYATFFSLDEVGVIVGDGQVVGLERFFRDADAVHGVPAFVVTQQAVALLQFGGFDPLRVLYFAPVVMSRRGGERGVSLCEEGVDGVGDDGLGSTRTLTTVCQLPLSSISLCPASRLAALTQ